MAQSKKGKTGLSKLILDSSTDKEKSSQSQKSLIEESKLEKPKKERKEIVHQTLYLPPAVHKQLRIMTASGERGKNQHDYILEGLNLVFEKYGFKSIEELTDK